VLNVSRQVTNPVNYLSLHHDAKTVLSSFPAEVRMVPSGEWW